MTRLDLFGVPVDDVTMDQALDRVESLVSTPGPRSRQVATVNPEFIVAARHNPEFARVLTATDLNVPDGANLVRAARWLGRPLKERVGGCDLMERICARAAERGWKVYFLGAREGVAAAAAGRLCARYPGLEVAGCFAGSADAAEEQAIIDRVNASGAQVLFVAYGAPSQDLWIYRNRGRLSTRVAMGVGGSFDYIAGRVARAPVWMQRGGLEWLYRLLRQPWRMKRQLALGEFVWLVLTGRRHG